MGSGLYSFLKRFRSRGLLNAAPEPVQGQIQSPQLRSGQIFTPPSRSILPEELLRLEREFPRLQKLLRLPASRVAAMTVEQLHDLLDYEIEKLKRLNPQAHNVLEIARLLAIERCTDESQQYREEPETCAGTGRPEASPEEKPYPQRPGDKLFLGNADYPLILVDRPVGAGAENDAGLLEAVHAVMQVCTVPTEAILEDRPASGLLFAYSIAELGYMFSLEGAQVITLDDRLGRVYGVYIYFTAGAEHVPAEDLVFVEKIISTLSVLGKPPAKIALGETVCIDRAVEQIPDDAGHRHHRGEYYRQMLYEGDLDAELAGCDLWIGWCREKPAANLAMKVHQRHGWQTLGEMQIPLPSLGCRGAYRLLKRELFAGEPGVRIVPFEDRDPSDGYTGTMPKGSSLRIRRLL